MRKQPLNIGKHYKGIVIQNPNRNNNMYDGGGGVYIDFDQIATLELALMRLNEEKKNEYKHY